MNNRKALWDTRGQATVEYLIVGLALVVVIAALGVVMGRISDGVFVDNAANRASHALGNNAWESFGDVVLY